MKKLALLISSLALCASAFALAPEIEMDRLLLQAKSALDAKDYAAASESLAKAEKLGIKLPDTFYFHYGRAYAGAGKLEQGRSMLEQYLNLSGNRGKFYQEALVELNNIEAAIKKRDVAKLADTPQQRELDRLLLQAKTAMEEDKFGLAVESFEKAENIGIPLPSSFYFHFGRAYTKAQRWEEGRAMIEKYLNQIGSSGQFYQEALRELNNIDVAIKKRDADRVAAAEAAERRAQEDEKKSLECARRAVDIEGDAKNYERNKGLYETGFSSISYAQIMQEYNALKRKRESFRGSCNRSFDMSKEKMDSICSHPAYYSKWCRS